MEVIVASFFGCTQCEMRRWQGPAPQPWNILLRIRRAAMTITIIPMKSSPSVCPVIIVLSLLLQPKMKFKAALTLRPITRCHLAFARSAITPFIILETPYMIPTRESITPKLVLVIPYSSLRAGIANEKFLRTK